MAYSVSNQNMPNIGMGNWTGLGGSLNYSGSNNNSNFSLPGWNTWQPGSVATGLTGWSTPGGGFDQFGNWVFPTQQIPTSTSGFSVSNTGGSTGSFLPTSNPSSLAAENPDVAQAMRSTYRVAMETATDQAAYDLAAANYMAWGGTSQDVDPNVAGFTSMASSPTPTTYMPPPTTAALVAAPPISTGGISGSVTGSKGLEPSTALGGILSSKGMYMGGGVPNFDMGTAYGQAFNKGQLGQVGIAKPPTWTPNIMKNPGSISNIPPPKTPKIPNVPLGNAGLVPKFNFPPQPISSKKKP